MLMTCYQLKKYYFPTKIIKNVTKKHLPFLINFYGEKIFFNNNNLTYNERLKIENILTENIIFFLEEHKDVFKDFALAYLIENKKVLAEIIIQSIMVFSKLHNPKYKAFDIFLNPNSILYFDNLYPANIQRWILNKKMTILDYTTLMKEIISLVDNLNSSNIIR